MWLLGVGVQEVVMLLGVGRPGEAKLLVMVLFSSMSLWAVRFCMFVQLQFYFFVILPRNTGQFLRLLRG